VRHEGKDVEVTIGGKVFHVLSVEYGDKADAPQLKRTPGVYVTGPRYPGEGNWQQRRAAAKGQVRK
jgi:hypothetical protein